MEYLNYSGQGFVPFIIASRVNGGEDYTKDENFKKIMDWVYCLQAPDGAAPQINSTGYGIFPLNSLFADAIPGSAHYLGQLQTFVSAYGAGGTSPVEAFCLLKDAHTIGTKPFDQITVTASRGEVILRNSRTAPTRYVVISAKSGAERSAAELHGYADAGSFIYSSARKILVRQPGYAGYSASKELESAAAHNSVIPVVNGAAVYDAPDRSQALPPSADASVVQTKYTDDFLYARILMDLNGPKPVSSGDIFSINSSILSLRYEYISSNWMASRANMVNYGTCSRQFLMVNNAYLLVADDITRKDQGMQYAVSRIQGNNGNNPTLETAYTGAQTLPGGETVWSSGSSEILRAHTAALGGTISAFSGFEPDIHQSPDDSNPGNSRAKYYHAALKTAAPFIGDRGAIVSILEIDPSADARSSVTTRRSLEGDSAMIAFTVDGRGKAYGRYDLIMTQPGTKGISISVNDLPFPVSTDASLLVMSFPDAAAGGRDVKLFSNNASYVAYGPYTFLPADTGQGQAAFVMKTDAISSVPVRNGSYDFQLSQNYPNPFNPDSRITYSLPGSGYVTLTVYDLLGREIVRLADGFKEAGRYEAVFDASQLPSGIYLYRLCAGGTVRAKTMMVVK